MTEARDESPRPTDDEIIKAYNFAAPSTGGPHCVELHSCLVCGAAVTDLEGEPPRNRRRHMEWHNYPNEPHLSNASFAARQRLIDRQVQVLRDAGQSMESLAQRAREQARDELEHMHAEEFEDLFRQAMTDISHADHSGMSPGKSVASTQEQ